jgi:hypothetical protein
MPDGFKTEANKDGWRNYMTDKPSPFSDLDLQQAIELRSTLRDIKAERWVVPYQSCTFANIDCDGPRRDAERSSRADEFRAGRNFIRCDPDQPES